MAARIAATVAIFASAARAIDPQCWRQLAAFPSPAIQGNPPVACPDVSGRAADTCFVLCAACSTPEIAIGFDFPTYQSYCGGGQLSLNASAAGAIVASAFYNASSLQGYFWLDDPADQETGALDALAHLFSFMPRRDVALIFGEPLTGMDFLIEHTRLALRQYNNRLSALNVSWSVFLDAVLPYSVWDEKRDLSFRWRPRYEQLFSSAWINASSITQAMENLTNLIPLAAAQGVLALTPDGSTVAAQVPGQPIKWHSSVSPAYLSPQQVQQMAGSCTGTGIVLVAAARSIGIPAVLAGCSQSIPNDDHHWSEFYDPAKPGPFGTGWHTKEGVSDGNTGGPWDSPSGPMNGCLQKLIPGDQLNTMWASVYSSRTFLPALWANGQREQEWAFMGGVNRCGDYCTAWGCGANNTQHWTQAQCGPQAGR